MVCVYCRSERHDERTCPNYCRQCRRRYAGELGEGPSCECGRPKMAFDALLAREEER